MKMTILVFALLLAIRAVAQVPASAPKQAEATGPYFGQPSPGSVPRIFAPGILSLTDRQEARIAFSPDGNECFFTVPKDYAWSTVEMYYTKRANNVWTPQAVASFLRPGYPCAQPFFSADGDKLYFTSSGRIWVVERTPKGWGDAKLLPAPIDCPEGAGEYSQTTDGTAYFESNRSGGAGDCHVWRCRPQGPGQPLKLENLGPLIHSNTNDSDPFISADGKYLIYSSNRPGGSGAADLYVTFDDGKGGWTPPVNLNQYCPGINTDDIEYGASLSPDGRYLFFVRLNLNAKRCDVWWVENPISESARKNPTIERALMDGRGNIKYWMFI
jgi:Tol biopolymer transport system component